MAGSLDALDAVLDDIYAFADGDIPIETILAGVAGLVHSERSSLIVLANDGSLAQDSWPFDPEGLMLYARDYAERDTRVSRVVGSRMSGLLTTDHVMTPAEIAQCPVHQEFYRIYPECWNAMQYVMWGAELVVVPIAHRSAVKSRFTQTEQDLLSAVGPHLAKAIDMKRVLPPQTDVSLEGVLEAFSAFPEGIVVFDPAGRIVQMNIAAERYFQEGEPLRVAGGTVTSVDPASGQAILKLLSGTLRFQAGKTHEVPKPIVVRRGDHRMPLRLSAFGAPSRTASGFYGVLQIRDLADATLPSAAMIRQATGLTPTEAQLAHALLAGRKLTDLAREEGASEHTLRTHMRNIRAKLFVGSQSEALVAILRLCGG